MNWHTMFQPHILDRGIEYYEDGAVTEFEISSDGYEINAVEKEWKIIMYRFM